MPRTATKSIYTFFERFGIDSKHQVRPLPFSANKVTIHSNKKYNLDNVPQITLDFAKNRKYCDFESCCELAYYIYPCSLFHDLTILIGIRDPFQAGITEVAYLWQFSCCIRVIAILGDTDDFFRNSKCEKYFGYAGGQRDYLLRYVRNMDRPFQVIIK